MSLVHSVKPTQRPSMTRPGLGWRCGGKCSVRDSEGHRHNLAMIDSFSHLILTGHAPGLSERVTLHTGF